MCIECRGGVGGGVGGGAYVCVCEGTDVDVFGCVLGMCLMCVCSFECVCMWYGGCMCVCVCVFVCVGGYDWYVLDMCVYI